MSIQAHRSQLPSGILPAMAQSAVLTTLNQAFFNENASLQQIGAAVTLATTTALVEAAAQPVIHSLFKDSPFIEACVEIGIRGIALQAGKEVARKHGVDIQGPGWVSFLAMGLLNTDRNKTNQACAVVL